MTKKCIFLTGATGYLGSNLLPEFVKSGYRLKLLVRPQKMSSHERVAQSLLKIGNKQLTVSQIMQKIEILEGDIVTKNLGLSKSVIQNLSKEVTDVFHCAAAVSFDEEKESFLRKHNINGTENILSFTDMLDNTHLHYMSTAYVCGSRKGAVKENELDVGQGFYNSYERIKNQAESLTMDWTEKNKKITTVYRPSIIVGDSKTAGNFSNYGPYGILRMIDLSVSRLKHIYKKKNLLFKNNDIKMQDNIFYIPIRVIGRYEKPLNLITVDYAIKAIMSIFKNDNNIGKTYHITNSCPPTVGMLKDCIFDILKARGVKFVDAKVFDKKPMKIWESTFNRNIKLYQPYLLFDEPNFDTVNTQNVLRNKDIKQVKLDKNLITKLLAYCHSTKYGKISNPPDK